MTTSLVIAAGEGPLIKIGPLDIVIIAIYFLVVLGIGVYLKKYVSTGEDFFMAGRKMTAWIAGLSFISANLSSLETMGWSAMAYQYGMLGAHAYLIGAIPAILFLAIVMMPFYYICKTHSVPGYLMLRYGTGASALAGISFALLTVLVSGASMFAMAKILHLLLGWNMTLSIWVSSLTVAVYVTLGGLISAVFNEVLQYFLIWFGSLLIPILGLIDAGGWNAMMRKIQENVPIIHPSVGNADFRSLWRNLGSFDSNPMGIDWFGMVFGLGLAVSFGYWCTDFLQVQRVIVAKDLRSAQNGTIIGAVLKMLVPLIVTIPGLLGLAVLLNSDGSPVVLVPESDPRANITHRTFNDVLPLLMGRYLGPGLLGLGVTAMIAGFMSGMAGNVSAFATVWTYDVYRPLINRKASDAHYLSMGRWCSLLGVLMSIGTAYALFYFSNILEFLQVLIFFFIVPLFGVVIMGMLWKRATPVAAFVAFLTAMIFSLGMWVFVHTFPAGFRPPPRAELAAGSVVRVETAKSGDAERITRVFVEKGAVRTTNIALTEERGERTIPPRVEAQGKEVAVGLLAPDIVVSGTERRDKFGVEAVPVVLSPDVKVDSTEVSQGFNPAEFNPDHVQYIARSRMAKPMAVNVYSAFWTLVVCVVVLLAVTPFTEPKPDEELRDLVMGLTSVPYEGPCPWYKHPYLWATLVAAALVTINVIFW
ncbi:Sodium/glucose cotransporter [Aquisphaera giovannonii]|uniref:Sodium/glucose cotransporter n=1 Tax=Aquisphaera giovannonii TaxID=406548 RepID=A0A5B9W9T5_9BACT|nr:sodium/solute symporter [Aquisphaera giovannonii]QEH37286.1 Sodium/glucose cotransporter [Aquisphaera giovannonii]